jgi:hypothetical protein
VAQIPLMVPVTGLAKVRKLRVKTHQQQIIRADPDLELCKVETTRGD